MWEIFEKFAANHANSHCPEKNIKICVNSPQWFTKELSEEIYHRDRLYINAKFTNKISDSDLYKKKNKMKSKLFYLRHAKNM